jgi:hypothetical protein
MTELNDQDLQKQFQALREETAPGVPSFRALLARARARRALSSRRIPWLATAGMVVAVGAVALLFARPGPRGARIDLTTVHWKAPTDFLLELPGDRLLRSLPELGRVTHLTSDWRTL